MIGIFSTGASSPPLQAPPHRGNSCLNAPSWDWISCFFQWSGALPAALNTRSQAYDKERAVPTLSWRLWFLFVIFCSLSNPAKPIKIISLSLVTECLCSNASLKEIPSFKGFQTCLQEALNPTPKHPKIGHWWHLKTSLSIKALVKE